MWPTRIFNFVVLFGLCAPMFAQAQTGRPERPPLRQQADELTEMKADLARTQSLLNQTQAVFPLVGNPTSPANHELEVNIDLWRVLLEQMQRRIDRMEKCRQAERKNRIVESPERPKDYPLGALGVLGGKSFT